MNNKRRRKGHGGTNTKAGVIPDEDDEEMGEVEDEEGKGEIKCSKALKKRILTLFVQGKNVREIVSPDLFGENMYFKFRSYSKAENFVKNLISDEAARSSGDINPKQIAQCISSASDFEDAQFSIRRLQISVKEQSWKRR